MPRKTSRTSSSSAPQAARAFSYAVLGDPISASLSPRLFQWFNEQSGLAVHYHAIQTPLSALAQTLTELGQQGYHGVNLTAPLKEEAYRLVDCRTEAAEKAQSVNMITWKEGLMLGHNTDGLGFIRDVVEVKKFPLEQKAIVILGAGGAVRGLLPAVLVQKPRSITLVNRTEAKAKVLALEFGLSYAPFSALPGQPYDLLVQATSAREQILVPELQAPVWYDLNYGEAHQSFLNLSKKQKVVHCYDGLGMLLEQAALAFYEWQHIKINTHPLHQRLLTI